jgi:hypothetical protein
MASLNPTLLATRTLARTPLLLLLLTPTRAGAGFRTRRRRSGMLATSATLAPGRDWSGRGRARVPSRMRSRARPRVSPPAPLRCGPVECRHESTSPSRSTPFRRSLFAVRRCTWPHPSAGRRSPSTLPRGGRARGSVLQCTGQRSQRGASYPRPTRVLPASPSSAPPRPTPST